MKQRSLPNIKTESKGRAGSVIMPQAKVLYNKLRTNMQSIRIALARIWHTEVAPRKKNFRTKDEDLAYLEIERCLEMAENGEWRKQYKYENGKVVECQVFEGKRIPFPFARSYDEMMRRRKTFIHNLDKYAKKNGLSLQEKKAKLEYAFSNLPQFQYIPYYQGI